MSTSSSTALANIGSCVQPCAWSFSQQKIKQAEALVSQMKRVKEWDESFEFDITEFPIENLTDVVEGLQADEDVKKVIMQLGKSTNKQRQFEQIQYQNDKLETRHAFIAAHIHPETSVVTAMYIVYKTQLVLDNETKSSWLGMGAKKLSVSDIDLLKTTYMPLQLMRSLRDRKIVGEIKIEA